MSATVLATFEARLDGRRACSRCGREGPDSGWTEQTCADARGVWHELICPSCINAEEIKALLAWLAREHGADA